MQEVKEWKEQFFFKVKLSNRALTDMNIIKCAKLFKSPNFQGVFMRDELPKRGPKYRESTVINFDNSRGPGTHWEKYRKTGNKVMYFDSFGDLKPPPELMKYFRSNIVNYNYKQYQKFNTYNCGHLCLQFLSDGI